MQKPKGWLAFGMNWRLFFLFYSLTSPHVNIMYMERDALLWAIVHLASRAGLHKEVEG